MPNTYERGKRDGERGLEPAAPADHTAHDVWATHMLFHGTDSPECTLECAGLSTLKDDVLKRRRQIGGGLPDTHHHCTDCGADFRTESMASQRAEYNAGFEAGKALYARGQQRRRNDQQRRARRARRR